MIRKIRYRFLATLSISLLAFFSAQVNEIFADKIVSIKIEGNQRVENNLILKSLGLKVGDDLQDEDIPQLIKKLYAKSLFKKVSITLTNGVLFISVKESSLIGKIEFIGNKAIINKDLLKIISTSKGQNIDQINTTSKGRAINEAKIYDDIQNIKEVYNSIGYYNINITYLIKPSRNNTVKLVFKISEGPKTTVKNIHFSGNSEFNEKMLKSALLTKETKWYRFFDTHNVYDPNFLDVDKELLERYYNERGFADFKVVAIEAELSKDQQYFNIFYSVEEGDKYKLGTVEIKSDIDAINLQPFYNYLKHAKSDEIYNATKLDTIANKITSQLVDKGFSEISIRTITKKDNKNKIVNVVLQIENAENYFIGNINISGNNKTHDSIIRKIIKVQEGEVFKESLVGTIYRNLAVTNYFANNIGINNSTKAINSKNIDLDIKLQEQSTTGLNAGLSASGKAVSANANYKEINLFGLGKTAYVAGSVNTDKIFETSIGYIDPFFLDKNLVAGVKYRRSHSASNFTAENTLYQNLINGINAISHKITLDLAGNFTSNFGWDLEYGFSNNFYEKKTTTNKNLKDAYYSSIVYGLNWSGLDPISISPKGYKTSIALDLTGLGFGNKYIKLTTNASYYKSFIEDLLALKISAGATFVRPWGGEVLSPRDYFTLGENTFFGFEEGGIGPRKAKDAKQDAKDKKDDNKNFGIGGLNFIKFKTDLSLPLEKIMQVDFIKEFGFKGHFTVEAGTIWGYQEELIQEYLNGEKVIGDKVDIRLSASVGISSKYGSLFFSVPLIYKDYDKTQSWHFSFSQSM